MAQRQWRSDDTDSWVYGFGDGSDGSTYSVPSNEGCSGSSGGTSLTLSAAGSFSNGDLVLIHQTRGTGAGNWELNKISSGGGTTSLTMEHDLINTYVDLGASQAQIIELKQYDGLTISGTTTAPAWNSHDGGIIAFLDKGTTNVSGALNLAGKGYRGNAGGLKSGDRDGNRGEGDSGGGNDDVRTANGSGGGAALNAEAGTGGNSAGGGGGNGTAGSNGTDGSDASDDYGLGGDTHGNSSLTIMVPGGGGGGGAAEDGDDGGDGGNGGAMLFIFARNIEGSGSINLNGSNGESTTGSSGGGGAGAGGSGLFKAQSADFSSLTITASGGVGGSGGSAFGADGGDGGDGGDGRLHLDYADSYTGSTSPTLDVTQDSTIVPLSTGGASPMFFSSGGLTIG